MKFDEILKELNKPDITITILQDLTLMYLGLASLLIEKGVITKEEYEEYQKKFLSNEMRKEIKEKVNKND
jgi:hypothetical protein